MIADGWRVCKDEVVRVAYTSDLHVEHHPEVVGLVAQRVEQLGADVLVLAGDISHDLAVVEDTLRPFAGRQTLFVPGNHELWAKDSEIRYLEELAECAARAGVTYLPAGPVRMNGVAFAGQTGWFDYSMRNHARDGEVSLDTYKKKRFGALRWNDGIRSKWPRDDEAVARWMADRLAADLKSLPPELPRVVVTHHLPFSDLVFVRGAMPWDFLNAFMGARVLGEVIAADAAVVRVISGHTHARRRAEIGNFVAEVSPIGYPREYGEGNLARRVIHRVSTFML
jgi:Calcineurin-like phosphoesterase